MRVGAATGRIVDRLHRWLRELSPNKRLLCAGAVLRLLAAVAVPAQGLVLEGGAGQKADPRARADPAEAVVQALRLSAVIRAKTARNLPGSFAISFNI